MANPSAFCAKTDYRVGDPRVFCAKTDFRFHRPHPRRGEIFSVRRNYYGGRTDVFEALLTVLHAVPDTDQTSKTDPEFRDKILGFPASTVRGPGRK